MMFFVGIALGTLIGFAITCSKLDEFWKEGFLRGEAHGHVHGHIIARNNDLDEIMVEYGEDMARYKRVVE